MEPFQGPPAPCLDALAVPAAPAPCSPAPASPPRPLRAHLRTRAAALAPPTRPRPLPAHQFGAALAGPPPQLDVHATSSSGARAGGETSRAAARSRVFRRLSRLLGLGTEEKCFFSFLKFPSRSVPAYSFISKLGKAPWTSCPSKKKPESPVAKCNAHP